MKRRKLQSRGQVHVSNETHSNGATKIGGRSKDRKRIDNLVLFAPSATPNMKPGNQASRQLRGMSRLPMTAIDRGGGEHGIR